jgi:hypothetical protein
MQRIIIVLTLSIIVGVIAHSPALGGEYDSFDFSGRNLDWNSGFLLKDNQLLFANASETSAGDGNKASATAGKKEPSEEEIAEAINNPLSYLYLLWVQNDTMWFSGDALDKLDEDDKVMNTTLIQPIMPIQLTENWKAIFRPIIPINSFDTISGLDVIESEEEDPTLVADFDRETGLGDIVLWTAFSNQYKPPNVFGFGPTVMMDTASDDSLGTGKWSAGPMALAFHIGDKWIYGAVAQHWWSFAGDDDRDSVNLTDVQYVLRYRVTPMTNIGFGPNIRINWDADSDNKWSVPVGLGADTLVKLGPLPAKIGFEAYHYVEKPDDFGPEWQIRFLFVPVIPSPKWSQKPLF